MLQIHKPGQGKWARYLAAGSVGALVIYGCYSLYEYLNVGTWRNWTLFEIPGVDLKINLPFIIAFGVFAFFAILVYVLLNKPKIGDFLIETELEMKKISWPGRSELVDSSTIVIVTVVILALVIMVFDFMIQFFMRLIGRM
jgi:preprotein translocase SecE subunit